jgi:uncharacterized DUF497 family protein
MNFIWDPNKESQNLKKHGISFEEASHVFSDPQRVTSYDFAHSSINEDRYTVLGEATGRILFVVETEMGEDTIKLISARMATKTERKVYYGNF